MKKILVHFLGITGIMGFLSGSYVNLTNRDEALFPVGLIVVILSFLIASIGVFIDKEKNIFYRIFLLIIFVFLAFVFTGVFRFLGIYGIFW